MKDSPDSGEKTTPIFEIKPFGGNGWIAEFSDSNDNIAAALFANAVARKLREETAPAAVFTDVVAGINSLTLRFDPARADAKEARAALADAIGATAFNQTSGDTKPMEIPVCYGGEHGPDFDDLCTHLSLTASQLIEAHATRVYHVLTLGFAPGFAYLGPLDPALHTPRLDTPRPRVEPGAVGVAGAFTGVYPLVSPGGWRIIGRTPARLFDPKAPSPFLFEDASTVRFAPITASEFSSRGKAGP